MNTQLFVIVFFAAGILTSQGQDTQGQGESQCNPACSGSQECNNGSCVHVYSIVPGHGQQIILGQGPLVMGPGPQIN